MFVMRHKANNMSASSSANTSTSEELWFVDSGASNHITTHEDWFINLRTPDRAGYMETVDDTAHPIRHIDNVPFDKDNNKSIKTILHVQKNDLLIARGKRRLDFYSRFGRSKIVHVC